MTLLQLKKIIDLTIQRPHGEELEVCIPNNKGGMGGTSATKVNWVTQGIDWDSGKFLIFPENEMVELKRNIK